MRWKRLYRLIIFGLLIWGFYKSAHWIKSAIEKKWPMSPADIAMISGESASGNLSAITPPNDATEITWNNFKGSVSGIVRAWKWQQDGKTFLQVQGPVPVEHKKIFRKYTACTLYLARGFDIEKLWFDLKPGGKIEAWYDSPVKQKLQQRFYHMEISDMILRLTVRLPQETILGNVVFAYEENGLNGWIATERKNAVRHDNILEWILQ